MGRCETKPTGPNMNLDLDQSRKIVIIHQSTENAESITPPKFPEGYIQTPKDFWFEDSGNTI